MVSLRGFRRWSELRHPPLGPALPVILLISILHVLTSVAVAQEGVGDVKVVSDVDELVKAEADLRLLYSGQFVRNRGNTAIAVERRLTGILQRDPNSPFRFQVEQDLDSVGEILAKTHLAIATFYLQRFRSSGRGGTGGSKNRLLVITRKYPRFSQMDEVLLMLAEISVADRCLDDASAYLRKLISDYPVSSNLSSAFEKLNEIAAGSWESTEKPERR